MPAPDDSPLHLTAQDLEFRFLAGSTALAFTATVGERWRRQFERLVEPGDLGRWFVAAGLASSPPRVEEHQLSDARDLRESIYRAATSLIEGLPIGRRDVHLINRAASVPTPAPQLVGGTKAWTTDDPVPSALSVVARDAIELFTGPRVNRIRECASDECALLFLDTSRPGRRRWCSSETCGSRARSADYRHRQHAALPNPLA